MTPPRHRKLFGPLPPLPAKATAPVTPTGEPVNDDPELYAEWMQIVDRTMRIRTGGFSTSDFPDYGFRDAFRDDLTPMDVVDAILSGEGWTDA